VDLKEVGERLPGSRERARITGMAQVPQVHESAAELTLTPVQVGDVVRLQPEEDSRDIRVVTHVDGEAFAEIWISAVEAAQGHR
jgi:hypothetical protein